MAWDHNIDNEYKMSMILFQRVRFIHNDFFEICRGERSNVDVKFRRHCYMEIRFPLDDENTKEKYRKGSDIFRVVDNYFQLGFGTRQVWDLIDEIFTPWENISIKNQRVKKAKPLICGTRHVLT